MWWLLPARPPHPPSARRASLPSAAFARSASSVVPSSSATSFAIFWMSSFTRDLRFVYRFVPDVLWWAYRFLKASRSAVTFSNSAISMAVPESPGLLRRNFKAFSSAVIRASSPAILSSLSSSGPACSRFMAPISTTTLANLETIQATSPPLAWVYSLLRPSRA